GLNERASIRIVPHEHPGVALRARAPTPQRGPEREKFLLYATPAPFERTLKLSYQWQHFFVCLRREPNLSPKEPRSIERTAEISKMKLLRERLSMPKASRMREEFPKLLRRPPNERKAALLV